MTRLIEVFGEEAMAMFVFWMVLATAFIIGTVDCMMGHQDRPHITIAERINNGPDGGDVNGASE